MDKAAPVFQTEHILYVTSTAIEMIPQKVGVWLRDLFKKEKKMVPTMAYIAVTEPYIFLAYVIVPTTAHQHLKELQMSLNATISFISNVCYVQE